MIIPQKYDLRYEYELLKIYCWDLSGKYIMFENDSW